ncbi:VCBS repeat-containing protein [Myxococcota bacterium]|nr:VCBS repeat-containing protein [Myxococcota bacterium]
MKPLRIAAAIASPVLTLGLLAWAAGGDDAPFAIEEVPGAGRIVLAEIVDLDGDSRSDLFTVSFDGIPPTEKREMRVYFQAEDGSIPDEPDWTGPLPEDATAYDLTKAPGIVRQEVLLLHRRGLHIISFPGRELSMREITIPGDPTLALSQDERGLDRLQMVHYDLGDDPTLVISGLGESILLTPSGDVLGRLDVGQRANYFLPPRPGPMISESQGQIYFDAARMDSGDFDGDGRNDLIASTRHELRIFLQQPDGSFPSHADHSIPLHTIAEGDHIRGTGSVHVDAEDFNADGLVDLLVVDSTGGVFRAETRSRVFLNREGSWALDSPDQIFRTSGGFATQQLLDLDGDEKPELLTVRIPMNVLEIVELLITRSLDAEVRIHAPAEGDGFATQPLYKKQVSVSMDFETFRPRGFISTFLADVNADGRRDFLDSGGGEKLDIYLGGSESPYKKRAGRVRLDTDGRIRFGDFESDGFTDFLIHDPRRLDSPVLLGRNLGRLAPLRPKPETRR